MKLETAAEDTTYRTKIYVRQQHIRFGWELSQNGCGRRKKFFSIHYIGFPAIAN